MEKDTTQVYLWLCLFVYSVFHWKTRDDRDGVKRNRGYLLPSADNLSCSYVSHRRYNVMLKFIGTQEMTEEIRRIFEVVSCGRR